MESSELDRLDSSVKQLVERLTHAEQERDQLRNEKAELKNRLEQQARETNRIADLTLKTVASNQKIQEARNRLLAVVKRLKEIEDLI
ncbi:MAG: hypothetical protein Kow0074_07520 [Candidatus Zixiibacteriota bacterium]